MWTKLLIGCLLVFSNSVSAQDVFESARNGNIKQLKKLIKLNKDTIQAVNQMGFDPLMIACYRGQTKCAEFLIKNGANVNRPSPEGSALQAASYQNNMALAKVLVEGKANLNVQGPDGNTALMYAVLNQNMEMVQLLVKAGSDLKLLNKDNQSAHSLAMSLTDKEIQRIVEIR